MNTAERINKIYDGIKVEGYLEIGVHNGTTFNALNFNKKVAVDPNFLFDYKGNSSPGTIFHEMVSDKYFMQRDNNNIFDLIFIDGLHEYKQTLRDFINSIDHSCRKTVFIIDDVYPNDIFSSLMLKDPIRFRNMNNPNNTDGSWHGDVYKTIFMLHDLFPKYSYSTIDWGYGNPQTYVYKSPRVNFMPRFKSLEEIDRASYFDLIDNLDLLKLKSEGEVIEEVRSFLLNEC